METQALRSKVNLPVITAGQILSWKPRKEAVRFIPKKWRGTVLDVLGCDPPEFEGLSRYDWLLWVALRNECFPSDEFAWKILRLFACDCAGSALKKYWGVKADKRSVRAVEVSRKYAHNEVSIKELAAAYAEAKAACVEARAVFEASALEAESRRNIRSAYANVDPVDYSPMDADAAARNAVRAYMDPTAVDNAVADVYGLTRIFVRAHCAEAVRAACDAVADTQTAAREAVYAARADFHISVYNAARVAAKDAAEAVISAAAEKTCASVLASDDPLRAAQTTDNQAIFTTAEEAFTSEYVAAYNAARAHLDAEERRRQIARLKELIVCELTEKAPAKS